VYDTPRYEDQTLNKVWLHLSLAQTQLGLSSLQHKFGNKRILDKNLDIVKHELQQLDLIDADEINCKQPDNIDGTDLFDQFYIGDAINRTGGESYAKLIATGSAIHKILSTTGDKPVWTDYDASIRITHGYLKGTYVGNLADKDMKIYYKSSMDSVDICVLEWRLAD